jgi:hypothetical protein
VFKLHRVLFVLALFGAALLVPVTPVSAQKTDVIVIENGDRITGEIRSVDRGKLTYKTDDMGTLSVKWDKVLRITSPHFFEIEVQTGEKFYGSLQPSTADREMIVAVAGSGLTLDMWRVVRIYPIESSFWHRMRGYADLGFTFQRANRNRQFTLAGHVDYRGVVYAANLDVSSYAQSTESQGTTITRNSAAVRGQRFRGERWSVLSDLSIEQNDELELDHRTLVSLGAGYFLTQRVRGYVQLSSGVSWSNERYIGSESAVNSAEAFFTTEGAYYQFDTPKTDFTSTLKLYPSLTDFGRVRVNIDARLSYEVFKDFTIGPTVFDNFDSRPPSETAAKNDYGFTLSVGYKFNM